METILEPNIHPVLVHFSYALSISAFVSYGIAWVYAYGWYTALVFVPLYKFFNKNKAAA